jgi:hypothetical protein
MLSLISFLKPNRGGGVASIEIERDIGGLTDALRSYKVVIDDEVVGKIGPGESRAFNVAADSHEIFMKMEWLRSEKFNVRLTADETVLFRCEPRANPLTDLYWGTLGRHRYIRLTQVTT